MPSPELALAASVADPPLQENELTAGNAMLCEARAIWKVWVTLGAAAKFALPSSSALMAQVPPLSIVTVLAATLHAVAPVEKTTGLPDAPPVTLSANAASVATLSAMGAKEMIWGAFATVSVLEPLLAWCPGSPPNDTVMPVAYVPALIPAK